MQCAELTGSLTALNKSEPLQPGDQVKWYLDLALIGNEQTQELNITIHSNYLQVS